MEFILIILVILTASLIKGITGFGFALVSLPFLLFWYEPKAIIPVLILCNLFASVLIVLQKKRHPLVNKRHKTLLIYGGFSALLGVVLLKSISSDLLIQLIAAFFVILCLIYLFNIKYSRQLKKYTYKLAGIVCGILTGSIAVGGPPLALFLNISKANNEQFREVFAWFNIVAAGLAAVGYWIAGLLTWEILRLSLIFIPILFFGSFTGKRINGYLPSLFFRKATIFLTMISSLVLLIRAI